MNARRVAAPAVAFTAFAGLAALSSTRTPGASAGAALPPVVVAAMVLLLPVLARRFRIAERLQPTAGLAGNLSGGLTAAAFGSVAVWSLLAGPAGIPAVLAAFAAPAGVAILQATGSPPLALVPAAAAAALAGVGGDGTVMAGLGAGIAGLLLGGWHPGMLRGLLAALLVLAAAAIPAGALLLHTGLSERLPAPLAAAVGLRSGAVDAALGAPLLGHGIGAAVFTAPAAPRAAPGHFSELSRADQEAAARMLGYRGPIGQGGLSAHLAAHPDAAALGQRMEQAGRWDIPDGAGNGRVVFGGFATLSRADQEAVARTLGYHGPIGQGGLSAHLAAHPDAAALGQRMEQDRRWETGNPRLGTACPAPACNGFTRLWLDTGAAGTLLAVATALLWLSRTSRSGPVAGPAALALATGGLAVLLADGGSGSAGWIAGAVLAGAALPAAAALPQRRPTGGILVLRPDGLHGFVSALPACAALGRHHADERLTLLTTPGLAPLARRSGLFDAVWCDPPDGSPAERAALRRRLRTAGFRLVYDLRSVRDCRLRGRPPGLEPAIPWLTLPWSGGEWPQPDWVGPPDAGVDDLVDDPQERHRRQLAARGIAVSELPDVSWLTADTDRFGLPEDIALLVPGGPADRLDWHWPPNHYAKLARALVRAGIRPVVLGTGQDADLARRIRVACPDVADLSDTATASEIAALAHRARIAVGGDSGPLRLIAATGCRTVALLQERAATRGPRGSRVTVLRDPCLAFLSVDAVLRAIVDLVNGAPAETGPGAPPAASTGRQGAVQRAVQRVDRRGQRGAPVEGNQAETVREARPVQP